jgi:integrase
MREARLVRYRGKYAVKWWDGETPKRSSLRTNNKQEAERRLRDWRNAASRVGDTVAEIMEAYLEDRKRHATGYKTLEYNWRALAKHFRGFAAEQISRDSCRGYIALRRSQGVGDGTIRREIGTLRAGIRWARPACGAVFLCPPAPPPKERHLTREEYKTLLAGTEKEPHIKLFTILALATAGRTRAILDLTWDRVDFERGLIRLSGGAGRRKGRATVPMTQEARNALLEAQEAALSDFVIEWAGKPVKRVVKGFKAACLRAGLDDVSPHVLRHTAAVWMAEAGNSMSEIAAYLGHSDSRITERVYARFSPDYLRKASKALEG